MWSNESIKNTHDLLYFNRPVQKCNLSDPRRALVYGRILGILFILKHIFPHFYSLEAPEAPVMWRPHRRKLALSRKHFRNAFLMK
jgi:hypothetical protein